MPNISQVKFTKNGGRKTIIGLLSSISKKYKVCNASNDSTNSMNFRMQILFVLNVEHVYCTTSSYSLLTLDSTKHNEGQSQALCNCCGEIVSVLFALECLNDFEHTVQASDRQCQMVSLKNNTSGPVLNVKRLLIHYRSALVIMENELLFTSVQASVLHQILLIITAFRTFDSNHNNEQSSSKTGFPKLFLKQTRQLTSRQAFEYKPPSDSNAEATGK
ncbi:hypothetical protein Tco_0603199 [Tanacetum coccineum]